MSESVYRDRCEGYVPTTRFGDLKPTYHALIGDPHNEHQITTLVPVALADADELNRSPSWWWAQIDPGSADGTPEHWSHFEGWDIRIGVELRTWNHREVNDWKGRDEIQREGHWMLTFNDQVVFGGYVRDAISALTSIGRVIGQLRSLPLDWRAGDYRSQIEGRKVYYRDTPATLSHWMPGQGCVMAVAVEGVSFPPHAYDIDNRTGTDANPEHNYSEESAREAKVELLSPDLWWWRQREDFTSLPARRGEETIEA